MDNWMQILLTVFSSVLASSGLWAYIAKRAEKKDVKTEMLIGLGHDRIMYLGMSYIDRGGSLPMNMRIFTSISTNRMKRWAVTALPSVS